MSTNNHFDEILNHIGPDTIGAIWFSENSIKEISPLHSVFDYLVDGSITKMLTYLNESNIDVEKENNFFISNGFNSPFILFNSCVSKEFSKKDFQDFNMILERLDVGQDKSLAIISPKNFTLPNLIEKSKFNIKKYNY